MKILKIAEVKMTASKIKSANKIDKLDHEIRKSFKFILSKEICQRNYISLQFKILLFSARFYADSNFRGAKNLSFLNDVFNFSGKSAL